MPEIFKENINEPMPETLEKEQGIRRMENYLMSHHIDEALEIRREFSLRDEQIIPVLKNVIKEYITHSEGASIENLLKRFEPVKDIVKLPEFKEMAEKRIIKESEYARYNHSFISLKRIFSLDGASLMEVDSVKKWVDSLRITNLKEGYIYNAIEIEDNFFENEKDLPEEVMKAAEYGMMELLRLNNISDAHWIKNRYSKLPMDKFIDFFKKRIDEYDHDKDAASKFKKADKIWDMVFCFPECRLIYEEFLNKYKKIANNAELSYQKRREAFDSLGQFAEFGDENIVNDFSEIIKERSKQSDAPESKWGLDPFQETAFYTLLRADNNKGQEVLLNLTASENVNLTIKVAILKKITSESKNFFNTDVKNHFRRWLYSKPFAELDWRDLIFIRSIMRGIPNEDVRIKSGNQIAYAMEDFIVHDVEKNKSIYRTWQEKYQNIPVNTFLQLYKFTDGESDLMEKFKELYASIKKDNNKKNDLLYGIVGVLDSDVMILEKLKGVLGYIDFGNKDDVQKLINVLRGYVLIDKLRQMKSGETEDEGEDYNYWLSEESSDYKSASMDKLEKITNDIVLAEFKRKLNNSKITIEKVRDINRKWNGNIEPIITYISRFPDEENLQKYIMEMMVNFDDEKKWKEWRYDLNNEDDEKLDVWRNDYFVNLKDFVKAEDEGDIDKAERAREIIENAVLLTDHIYNRESPFNGGKNKIIYKHLNDYYDEIQSNPAERNNITNLKIKNLENYTEEIDKFIKLNNSERIEKILNGILPIGKEIIPKKIKSNLDFLSAYLPKDLSVELADNFKRLNKDEKVNIDELLTPETREKIEEEMGGLTKEAEGLIKSSEIWDKFALNRNNLNDLNQFHRARQEAKIILDLFRLNNLSADLININRVDAGEDKKGGRTLTDVLESLKKFFKDSPFFNDLENIKFLLKGKLDEVDLGNLAMFFTDDPQILWQVGKYPFGCASCQHYDGNTSWSINLMGYVGDAHSKVAFLIDLNKLPESVKKRIAETGFDEFKKEINNQELLEASVARAMVKIALDSRNESVILIEPTYSKVNKDDKSMNRYFDLFVDSMIASPMGFKIGRGGGDEKVSIWPSRSPKGQYEDLILNNIKFISC